MALKLWLKLTGDKINTGADGLQFEGNPASWGNGILGKCATFNGSQAIYLTTTEYNYTDKFSWSIWVKTSATSLSATHWIFTVGRTDAAGWGYGLQETSTSSVTVWFGNSTWPISCTGGEWTHIAFVKSGTNIKIYKNGETIINTEFSGTLPTWELSGGVGLGCFRYSSGNIYFYYGDMCDFRIYDHALSHLEVRDISKALVCHYTFDDISTDQFRHDGQDFLNYQATSTTYNPENDSYTIVSKFGSSAISWANGLHIQTGRAILPYGYYYRFTCDVFVPTTHSFTYDMNNKVISGNNWNGSDNDDRTKGSIKGTSNVPANTWTPITVIGYNGHASNTSKMGLYIYDSINLNSGSDTSETTWYIKNYKFETSPTSDFSKLEITSGNTVYDTSGFGNHGTLSNNMEVSNDCARGINSIFIDGTNKRNVKISPWLSVGQNVSTMSMSIWYKGTAPSNLICLDQNTFIRFRIIGNNSYEYLGDTGVVYPTGSINTMDNNWHMATLVFNNGVIKFYHDGQLIDTHDNSANSKTMSPDGLNWYLGSYDTSSEFYNGLEDDARFYMTALTDNDVLRLYKTSIHVGKNSSVTIGNTHEWIRTANSVIFDYKMNANVTHLDESSDYTTFKSMNDGYPKSTQFYSDNNELLTTSVDGNLYVDKLNLKSGSQLEIIGSDQSIDSDGVRNSNAKTATNIQIKTYIDNFFKNTK